ncbi:MAG TPA: hypothetical protein VLV18_05370 [Terriglobales bacterium]|nr:hypothetical protein [Terriglobales bacterium]
MLPSIIVRSVGICLLIIGVYDTSVYVYSVMWAKETFDLFGHKLHPRHPIIVTGFAGVLAFYFVVGALMLMFG